MSEKKLNLNSINHIVRPEKALDASEKKTDNKTIETNLVNNSFKFENDKLTNYVDIDGSKNNVSIATQLSEEEVKFGVLFYLIVLKFLRYRTVAVAKIISILHTYAPRY